MMTWLRWSVTVVRLVGVDACPSSWGAWSEVRLLGHGEVVEARLEAREVGFAAFGGELALFEGFVVALECQLGAGDLGADRRQPPVDRRAAPL